MAEVTVAVYGALIEAARRIVSRAADAAGGPADARAVNLAAYSRAAAEVLRASDIDDAAAGGRLETLAWLGAAAGLLACATRQGCSAGGCYCTLDCAPDYMAAGVVLALMAAGVPVEEELLRGTTIEELGKCLPAPVTQGQRAHGWEAALRRLRL